MLETPRESLHSHLFAGSFGTGSRLTQPYSSILKKLGVKTVVALPGVGENMQDHNAAGTAYPTLTNITGRTILAAMPTAADILGANFSAVAASTLANLPLWAQQASNYTNGAVSTKAFLRRFTVQHDLIFRKNVTIAELFPTNAGTALIPQLWVTMPFSWGSVHLGDLNKIDEPVIDSGLLRFDIDYQLLTAATKLSRRAYHSAPLTDIVGPEATPGDAVLPVEADDDAYRVYLRQNCEFPLDCFVCVRGWANEMIQRRMPFMSWGHVPCCPRISAVSLTPGSRSTERRMCGLSMPPSSPCS